MEKPPPSCPYFGSNSRAEKAGLNGTRSQRMSCMTCPRYFTPQHKPMGYSAELRAQAIKMHLERMTFRAVGRTFGVNFQNVINWFNQAHDALRHQVEDTLNADLRTCIEGSSAALDASQGVGKFSLVQ